MRLRGEAGQAALEAVIVLPVVVLIVFSILNMVFAARSQLILDYVSYVVARTAAVRPPGESKAGVPTAKVAVTATIGDFGALIPDNTVLQPLKIKVKESKNRIISSVELQQRQKWVPFRGVNWFGSLLELVGLPTGSNLFYDLRGTTVTAVDNYPGRKKPWWRIW